MALAINMVTKNEEGRYLEACMSWAATITDRIFVFDDQSTDETVEIAHSFGAKFEIRQDGVPSFVESESLFRYCGWAYMLNRLNLEVGDWVLSIDADEFPIGDMMETLQILHRGGWKGAQLKIWEMWNRVPLMHRTDGFWGTITGVRLCRVEAEDHSFRSAKMGCGSVPAFAMKDPYVGELPLEILHMGYADVEDQCVKYEFYNSNTKNGHNNKHIQSIMTQPELALWTGAVPGVWRGVK